MRPALLLAALLVSGPAVCGPPLPSDSIYHLELLLTDQQARSTTLAQWRGGPVLISMFYGSCPHVCPMLISTMQRIERELPETQRARLRVLMVSVDPDRDTPATLRELASRHRADQSRWTFARADADGVRKLAAMLNIQYRRLPDGEFNHSSVITLLDAQGRIRATTSSMLRLDPDFLLLLKSETAR